MRFHVFVYSVILGLTASAVWAGTPEDLWQAARDGDVKRVEALLEAGVPVDAKTEYDCTALYFAANSNHADVVRLLLEKGADVNVRDNSYGFTAVGMAAWLGHAEAVAALIDGGADVGDVTGSLFAATSNKHADVVEVGLAKLELEQAQLDSLLAMALRSQADAIAVLLKKAGAKPPEAAPQAEAAPAAEAAASSEQQAPAFDAALDKPVKVAAARPWPEFRGAGRSGIADGQHPPLSFELESGRNVRWRAPVDGLGLSSPIIWGDRIIVTTAVSPETEQKVEPGSLGNIDTKKETSRHEWQVHSYDLRTGEAAWKKTVHTGVPRSQRHWKASQANPTAATDGEVIIAFFGSAGLFAVDMGGKVLWSKDLGRLDSGWFMDPAFEWGFGSSPILDGDRVIVQIDVHGESRVAAFERKTGKALWSTAREELPSWGTPLIYRDGERAELVLAASKAIVGYDPSNGDELWRLRGNSEITVASPIARDGLIVVTGGYRTPKPIYAIKPGARGDITPPENGSGEHVAWSTQKDGAYHPTPLLYRGVLYVLRDQGVLTGYDPATGEQLFRERVRGRFTASPVAADGRLYLTAEDGDVYAVQAGREFRLLAKSELDGSALATPAISNGLLVFRTVAGLVGVGSGDAGATDADQAEPAAEEATSK